MHLIICVGNVSSLVLALSSFSFLFNFFLFLFFLLRRYLYGGSSSKLGLTFMTFFAADKKKILSLPPFCCCLRLPQISRQVGQYENVFIVVELSFYIVDSRVEISKCRLLLNCLFESSNCHLKTTL